MAISRAMQAKIDVEAKIAAAKATLIEPETKPTPTFKRSDLADPTFYRANEKDILKAVAEGKVIDDVSHTKHGAERTWAKS